MKEWREGGRGVVWLGLRGLTAPKAAVLGPLPKPCLVAPLQGGAPMGSQLSLSCPQGSSSWLFSLPLDVHHGVPSIGPWEARRKVWPVVPLDARLGPGGQYWIFILSRKHI